MSQIQVLIIDWYDAQAKAIKYMFENIPHDRYNFSVQKVVEIEQAEKLIRDNEYHLIMLHDPLIATTNQKMKRMKESCFRLIEQIRQSDMNSTAAIVVYSGGYFDMLDRKWFKRMNVVWMEGVITLGRFQQQVEETLDAV